MDYRCINALTVRDSYQFQSIDSIMYAIGRKKVLTTLDCSLEFLQIEIYPVEVRETAFICHKGLLEFMRLPFSLSESHDIAFNIEWTLDLVIQGASL